MDWRVNKLGWWVNNWGCSVSISYFRRRCVVASSVSSSDWSVSKSDWWVNKLDWWVCIGAKCQRRMAMSESNSDWLVNIWGYWASS